MPPCTRNNRIPSATLVLYLSTARGAFCFRAKSTLIRSRQCPQPVPDAHLGPAGNRNDASHAIKESIYTFPIKATHALGHQQQRQPPIGHQGTGAIKIRPRLEPRTAHRDGHAKCGSII